MNREEELKNRLLDLLDDYGYNINGFQKAMKEMIQEDKLEPTHPFFPSSQDYKNH